jgi:hypothetical protein
MDWGCVVDGGDKGCIQNFGGKTFWKIIHLEDQAEDGWAALSWILVS